MAVVYGEYAPSSATVNCWAAEFRGDRRSLEDEPQSGRPSEAVCEENCRALKILFCKIVGVSVQLIADTVGIRTGWFR